ncbi:MAG: BT_3928 family protein [Bacteroidota bacterium]
MKLIDNIVRFIVGGLFIFSGLVKLNDPVGTEIKLEEYFDVFSTDFGSFFEIFIPYALPIGLFLVVLEIVLGVAVLINYKVKTTIWILLVMIIYFTFLTGYSAILNKVTDCGCFGDAIPLTPWQSFYKDLILVVLIGYLFMRKHTFEPLLRTRVGHFSVGVITIVSFFVGIYAINHLPYIDFRDYEIGNNLPALMQPSEELKYGKQVYTYTNKVTGEDESFEKWDNKYSDTTTYKYKSYERPLLNPEALPKITDYSVIGTDGQNVTQETFNGAKLLLVINDVTLARTKYMTEINALVEEVRSVADPIVLTASGEEAFEAFRHEYQLAVPYYFTDATVLKAMVRANPGILVLKNGTVLGKWHNNDVPSAEQVISLLQ